MKNLLLVVGLLLLGFFVGQAYQFGRDALSLGHELNAGNVTIANIDGDCISNGDGSSTCVFPENAELAFKEFAAREQYRNLTADCPHIEQLGYHVHMSHDPRDIDTQHRRLTEINAMIGAVDEYHANRR